jgi:peroxiredoxin
VTIKSINLNIMKTIIITTLLFCGFTGLTSFAQIPGKAEDISPLLYGETIPEAMLVSPDGSKQSLLALIGKKPTVLLFYRGGWCPYCNTHLAEIQQAESEIIGLGYQIVAVSPDSPENLKGSVDKNHLKYDLYSDGDGTLAKAMGIAFQAPGRSSDMLKKWSGGFNNGFLPVPSLFVVDTSGTIVFEYINPEYKTRLSSDLLLAVLKALKNKQFPSL